MTRSVSERRQAPIAVLLAFVVAGCGAVASTSEEGVADGQASAPVAPEVAGEAAPECGFEPGTPLIFAGRSTTSTLGVQEVIGDPMSDDSAEIYITRDEFDQGELRGRLVCAVYVEPPGFVEITVVPEGWEPGGPRPPDPPTPAPTPRPEQPSSGIARADAIAIAREAAPRRAGAELGYVTNGPVGDVAMGLAGFEWAAAIPSDAWLWQVTFRYGNGQGTTVLIDYVDGTVYGSFDWIE